VPARDAGYVRNWTADDREVLQTAGEGRGYVYIWTVIPLRFGAVLDCSSAAGDVSWLYASGETDDAALPVYVTSVLSIFSRVEL
jgi:hypothetical protein